MLFVHDVDKNRLEVIVTRAMQHTWIWYSTSCSISDCLYDMIEPLTNERLCQSPGWLAHGNKCGHVLHIISWSGQKPSGVLFLFLGHVHCLPRGSLAVSIAALLCLLHTFVPRLEVDVQTLQRCFCFPRMPGKCTHSEWVVYMMSTWSYGRIFVRMNITPPIFSCSFRFGRPVIKEMLGQIACPLPWLYRLIERNSRKLPSNHVHVCPRTGSRRWFAANFDSYSSVVRNYSICNTLGCKPPCERTVHQVTVTQMYVDIRILKKYSKKLKLGGMT